jgi:hypothetical protein
MSLGFDPVAVVPAVLLAGAFVTLVVLWNRLRKSRR